MASKTRVFSRRKYSNLSKVSNEENHAIVIHDDDDNDFEALKSPTSNRRGRAGPSNVVSPGFRSPSQSVVTPTTKSKKGVHDSSLEQLEDTSLDESLDKLSQGATPSKWSCLLPDYYSSQSDDIGDVLWDCASPDAIKHLRRRQRGDKSIKEIVKHFSDNGLPNREEAYGPLLQLDMLRASLQHQLQQKQNPRDISAIRKQKKLMRKRQHMLACKEQEKLLFGNILSAVEKRKELEAQLQKAQENNALQSECLVNPVVAEVAITDALEENIDGDDDIWEDDDLFHDNSFILRATQSPEQFLRISRTASSSTPKHAAVAKAKGIHECFFDSTSNDSVLDSQNSGVIPSSLMPGGCESKFNVMRVASGSTFTGQPNNNSKNNFNRDCVTDKCSDKVLSINGVENNGALSSGVGLRTASSTSHSSKLTTPDSPRSRFQGQRSVTMTPKRLMQNVQSGASNVSRESQPTASSLACGQDQDGISSTPTRRFGAPLQSNRQTGKLVLTAAQQNPPKSRVYLSASSTTVPGSSLQEKSTHSSSKTSLPVSASVGNGLCVPSTSTAKSGISLQQMSTSSFPNISGNTDVNKPVSLRKSSLTGNINTAKLRGYNKPVYVQSSVQVQVVKQKTFPSDKSKVNSAQVSAGSKPSSQILGNDLSDDGLSDEILLKLTEQENTFNSQVIQEYPTQPVVKRPAPMALLPTKLAEPNMDDFDDDLDAEVLASICDSFSESPKVAKKANEESVESRNGPSDKKQLRMQDALHVPQKSSTVSSISTGVNSAGENSFYPNCPVKPGMGSNVRPQIYSNCNPTATFGGVQSSSKLYLPQGSRQGAPQERAKPLSSLAEVNGVIDKTSEGGKKFVFKSVKSYRSAPVSVQQGSFIVPSKPNSTIKHPNTPGHGTVGMCSQAEEDNDEMMADDALYESQIIALLDQVESHATQQMALQLQTQTQVVVSSQFPISPPRCSQEEIEKKRQAALARKLRSKTRTT